MVSFFLLCLFFCFFCLDINLDINLYVLRLPGGPYMAHKHVLRSGFDEARAKQIPFIVHRAFVAMTNVDFCHWFPPPPLPKQHAVLVQAGPSLLLLPSFSTEIQRPPSPSPSLILD